MRRLLKIALLVFVGVLAWKSWGECVGDSSDGYRTVTCSNGLRYEGEMRNSVVHGQVTHTIAVQSSV